MDDIDQVIQTYIGEGGPGSGFHGHAGRPGKVGGSASGPTATVRYIFRGKDKEGRPMSGHVEVPVKVKTTPSGGFGGYEHATLDQIQKMLKSQGTITSITHPDLEDVEKAWSRSGAPDVTWRKGPGIAKGYEQAEIEKGGITYYLSVGPAYTGGYEARVWSSKGGPKGAVADTAKTRKAARDLAVKLAGG